MPSIRTSLLVTMIAFALALPALAEGPKPGKNKSGQGGQNKGDEPPPPRQTAAVPSVDNSGVSDARKGAAAARTEEKKALSEMNAVRVKLEKGFDSQPEAADAIKKVSETKAAYDAASAPIIKTLESNPDFKAAQDKAKKAEEQVKAMRGNASATPEQRTTTAKAALEARNAVTKARAEAVGRDPEVAAAKAEYDAANQALTKMRREYADSLKDNPDLAAAKQAVDDAKAKAKEADEQVSTANKDIAAQRAAREAALSEQRKVDQDNAKQKGKWDKDKDDDDDKKRR